MRDYLYTKDGREEVFRTGSIPARDVLNRVVDLNTLFTWREYT